MKPDFTAEYETAAAAILRAVETFERETGRTVDAVELMHADVTTLVDVDPQYTRTISLEIRPTPAERALTDKDRVDWLLRYARAQRLGGAFEPETVYEPLQDREQVDRYIRQERSKHPAKP